MTRSTRGVALQLVVLLLAASACGGKSFEKGAGPSGGTAAGGTDTGGTGSGGSNDPGGSPSGGTASAGSQSGGASTGGTVAGAGSGVGGSPQCGAFRNESGGAVPVRITNETMMPIYIGQALPGCGLVSLFTVSDAAGAPLVPPGLCSPSCEAVMQDTFEGCPAIACVISSAITLQAGESAVQQWDASYIAKLTLPPECRPASGTGECERVTAVKPGAFTFSAQAGTKLDCSQFGDPVCSACMPESSGGCRTYGAVVAGPLLSTEAKVMLDGSYGVGASGGAGMTRAVEIVFKQ